MRILFIKDFHKLAKRAVIIILSVTY